MKFPEQDVEALLNAVKKVGQTNEGQAVIELQALSAYDHSFYKRIEEEGGPDKAGELHKKVWTKHARDYFIEGKEDLEITEVNDTSTLGLITKIAFEKRGCIFDIVEMTPGLFVGVVTRDFLKEFAEDVFDEKPGSPYMRSLAAAQRALLDQLVDECGLSELVTVEQDKSLFLGDDMSRIKYSAKKGGAC
jgi:hypothetical protein